MKIAVAMSGGIDSAVSAMILKNEGHEVIGISADLTSSLLARHFGDASTTGGIEFASRVAETLGIPHHVVNLEDDFLSLVVDPFCHEYLRGRTPNPCVRCDAFIKFDRLLKAARSLGFDHLASGHYAALRQTEKGRYYVARGAEIAKDQSYFLYMLSQESMRHLLFPLESMTKADSIRMAHENRLPVANRPESQEICFIPDQRYPEFIEARTGSTPPPGDIVDLGGRVIGRHNGIHRYTVGQRRRLGIGSPMPLYVVAIDGAGNRIVAGIREDLEVHALRAGSICHMKETELDGLRVLVKTRSTQVPVEARLRQDGDGIIVFFAEPQCGISPGQAAVFYSGRFEVLGGGTIESAYADPEQCGTDIVNGEVPSQ